jgi:hypothetical protein
MIGNYAVFHVASMLKQTMTNQPQEMKHVKRSICFGLALCLAISTASAQKKDGWIRMFDGETLQGWKASENKDSWTVKDGHLVCAGPRSHLFYVGKDGAAKFKNFEFKCDVMTSEGSNAGIYFHSKFQEKGWPKYGFECQVNITHKDSKKTSSLYGVKNVSADDLQGLIKDGEWYTQDIIVKDNKVTLKVNGKTLVEYTEPADQKVFSQDFDRLLGEGTIALQAHDPKSVVHFRNLMIRPLP